MLLKFSFLDDFSPRGEVKLEIVQLWLVICLCLCFLTCWIRIWGPNGNLVTCWAITADFPRQNRRRQISCRCIKGAFHSEHFKGGGGGGSRSQFSRDWGSFWHTTLFLPIFFRICHRRNAPTSFWPPFWPPWPPKSRMLSRDFKIQHPRMVWSDLTFHCHQITIFTFTRSNWVISGQNGGQMEVKWRSNIISLNKEQWRQVGCHFRGFSGCSTQIRVEKQCTPHWRSPR